MIDLVVDVNGHVWSPALDCGAVEYVPATNQWNKYPLDTAITAIVAGRDGSLFAVGTHHIFAYQQVTTTLAWKEVAAVPGNNPVIAPDNHGGVWLVSRETGSLWHYAHGEETLLGQQSEPQALSALYANDRLWAIDQNTLAFYANGEWRHIPTAAIGNISELTGGPDGRLWLSGDRGVAVYDPRKDQQP